MCLDERPCEVWEQGLTVRLSSAETERVDMSDVPSPPPLVRG